MKKRYSILFFLIFTIQYLSAQRYDNAWLFSEEGSKNIPDIQCKGFCDGFVLSFEPNGIKFTPKSLKMDMADSNASICDKEGNLQCYTNGWFIRNYLGDQIDNGDTLNKPTETDDWSFDSNNLNYGGSGSSYFIPDSDTIGLFYLFHQKGSRSEINIEGVAGYYKYFLVTKVDMRQNGGKGKVVYMNKELYRQPSSTAVHIKHGNGKYWWAVIPNLQPINYYIHLINKDSILQSSIQKPDKSYPDSVIGYGQKCFSLDGSLYADCNSFIGPRVFQFDRCTGKMTLYKQHIWKAFESGRYDLGPNGVAISPNNRFLYLTYSDTLTQYDLEAPDFVKSRVVLHKGQPYRFTKGWNFPYDTLGVFRGLSHGPDGKIYVLGDPLGTEIYVINKPNEKGIACDFCARNCMSTPFFTYGNPQFPNYRLGPLKGSPCDTILGVANKDIKPEDYGIKLFPNPSSTIIKIDITIPQYDPLIKTEVVLVDVSGAIVMRYVMPDFAYIAELDISKLPSGVYGVQLRQPQKFGTRVLATEKLVVID